MTTTQRQLLEDGHANGERPADWSRRLDAVAAGLKALGEMLEKLREALRVR
jgi:hypothetical protein